MLINESGLVRCIKRAYKSAGYAVAAEGDCMTIYTCLLYTSPSPRDQRGSRMPSSA